MTEGAPYDVRSVANYVLDERERFGLQTTHLELQKIVYFCHGLCLARNGVALVDGYFEAWDHGPVHPYLYQLFKKNGASPILSRSMNTNLLTGDSVIVNAPEDFAIKQLISEVVLQLRALTASQLRAKSHSVGGPWHSVRESAKTELASRVRIPDTVILDRYFRHMSSIEDVARGSEHDEDHTIEPYRSSQ